MALLAALALLGLAGSAQAISVGAGQDYATLQEAVDAWTAGEVIEIHAGTYTSTGTAVVHIHDVVGMTLSAAEAGVVIDGQEQRVGICLANTQGVVLDGAGYGITIRHGVNSDLGHAYPFRRGSGVVDHGSVQLSLRNLVLSANDAGAEAYPACPGCDALDGLIDVVLEASSGVVLEEVDAVSAANANLVASVDDLVVRDSHFRHGRWYPARISGARPLVERSYFQASSAGDGGAAGGARIIDAFAAEVRYSVFDARGSGHAAAFELIGLNVNSADLHWIYNNLFLAGAGQVAAVRLARALASVTFQNNIFQHPSTAIRFELAGSVGVQLLTNLAYPGVGIANDSTPPSAFQEIDSILEDPLFVASGGSPSPHFHLRAESPAVDRAAQVNEGVGTDYDGTPVPLGMGPDIGAFEHDPQGSPGGSGAGGQGVGGQGGAGTGGDAGSGGAAAAAVDKGGCGCLVVGRRRGPAAPLALLLASLLLAARLGRRRPPLIR